MKCCLDGFRRENGRLSLTGWAVPENGNARLSYAVQKGGKEVQGVTLRFRPRPDVSGAFLGDPYRDDTGFFVSFPYSEGDKAFLVITESENGSENGRTEIPVSLGALKNRERLRKLKRSLKGPIAFAKKVKNKFLHTEARSYHAWFTETKKEEERTTAGEEILFSIVVPLYRTPVRVLNELVTSVLENTYSKFELILANASKEDGELEKALKSLSERDRRISVLTLPENGGIARNTNAAAEEAKGTFLCFLDHDDLLTKDALSSFANALSLDPEADVLYSDEDKVTEDSSLYYDPNFKPDYDPVLLLESQYISHFTAVRTSLFRKIGGLDPEYDGAQDHDLMLRLSERTGAFLHVAKVLYHWRSSPDSTASGQDRKRYAQNAGIRAVNRHLERRNLPLFVTEGPFEGRYVLSPALERKPLVSILIANRDHAEDLKRCVCSLYEKATYGEIEVIVIENGSAEEKTFDLYREFSRVHPSFRVVSAAPGPFNYAKLHNDAVPTAQGEYLLLLNNDTEVGTPDFLEHMTAILQIPGVGAVGAKLLYPDRSIQHAGIVTGEGGVAFHPFKGEPEDAPGYMCRAVTTMSVSAVTGACLLVRKSDYESAGGMDERLAVALNDVDLCFKLRQDGKRIVIDEEARLTHFESKSRGNEDTEENFVRYGGELRYFADKWRGSPLFPDPAYPRQFSLLAGYERKKSGT